MAIIHSLIYLFKIYSGYIALAFLVYPLFIREGSDREKAFCVVIGIFIAFSGSYSSLIIGFLGFKRGTTVSHLYRFFREHEQYLLINKLLCGPY